MDLYAHLVRPFLFRMEPDVSHRLARPVLQSPFLCSLLSERSRTDPRLETRIGDLALRGPVGLAPGFDKYGELTAGSSRLGFDYLVPGTIMADPEPDLPGRTLIRLPLERALINCMGLPSKGVEHSAHEIERRGSAVPLVCSIGARDIDGFLRCHALIEPLSGAVELNVQCHNEDPGPFDDPSALDELLSAVVAQKRKPLFLRVNAYHDEEERDKRLQMTARAFSLGVDGFSAVGTFLSRTDKRLSRGRGTVTGEPLREFTLKAVNDVWNVTGGQAIIRARGGIATGGDAYRAIAAGASTVEVFTAFVFGGWKIADKIRRELLAKMDEDGIASLTELRGRAHIRSDVARATPPY